MGIMPPCFHASAEKSRGDSFIFIMWVLALPSPLPLISSPFFFPSFTRSRPPRLPLSSYFHRALIEGKVGKGGGGRGEGKG